VSQGALTGECPFCGSGVTEDLVTYGGTCPKCFAEIPGEEAATDPGVEVRAAQERRDRRRATLRAVIGLSAMLLLVTCTGVFAVVTVLWPEPEVADLLDFDTLDFPMPDIKGIEDAATAKPRPRRTPAPGSEPAPEPAPVAGSAPRLRTDLTTVSPELGGNGGVSAPPGLSIDAPKVRRDDNVVLSDPDAIRNMIGERMVEFIPGLNQCYERRLKSYPSLKGRWKVKFTVTPSGATSSAVAEPLDRGDAELERCLAEHIQQYWKFGQIAVNQPIQKTLRFYPQ
jgi:hypothetical protein